MPDYNVQAEIKDIIITAGDPVQMSWDIYKWDETLEEWVLFDVSGLQVDLQVRKCDGTLIQEYSSAGVNPEITVLSTEIFIVGPAYTKRAKYKYDVQITDGTIPKTIRKGNWIVQQEITI